MGNSPSATWGVRLGLLMPRDMADDPRKITGAVAGPIVGDDPVDVGDAVGGEPDLSSGEERCSGGSLLVGKALYRRANASLSVNRGGIIFPTRLLRASTPSPNFACP